MDEADTPPHFLQLGNIVFLAITKCYSCALKELFEQTINNSCKALGENTHIIAHTKEVGPLLARFCHCSCGNTAQMWE